MGKGTFLVKEFTPIMDIEMESYNLFWHFPAVPALSSISRKGERTGTRILIRVFICYFHLILITEIVYDYASHQKSLFPLLFIYLLSKNRLIVGDGTVVVFGERVLDFMVITIGAEFSFLLLRIVLPQHSSSTCSSRSSVLPLVWALRLWLMVLRNRRR